MKRYFALLLAVLLVMPMCGCYNTDGDGDEDDGTVQKEYYDPFAYDPGLEPLEVEHGEDYVIEWEDAGMEAHVRLWLDKPEGDIYHSDVWEIRLISIGLECRFPYDMILEQPLEGETGIGATGLPTKEELRIYYDLSDLPNIERLSDLRHFDCLQDFNITCTVDAPVYDISGLDQCRNLQTLVLNQVQLQTLEPIGNMKSLQSLQLMDCGSVDLEPLAGLENLKELDLILVDMKSLEPLAELELIYLSLSNDMFNRNLHDNLDFTPITQMDSLLYLDVSNNLSFDMSVCETILSALDHLETINISYDIEESDVEKLREMFPNHHIIYW